MSTDIGFVALLEDLLAPVGPIKVKPMFGGAGIYAGGAMFAILHGEKVYFKTDEAGSAVFTVAGTGPFTYRFKSGTGVLKSFWQVPEALFDEPDEFATWARRAIAVARRGLQTTKRTRKPAPDRKGGDRTTAPPGVRKKPPSGRRSPRG